MNTSPFTTRLTARIARAAIVVGSFAATGLVAWFGSSDFQDFAGDQPLLLAAGPIAVAILTQIIGHLAGKTSKP